MQPMTLDQRDLRAHEDHLLSDTSSINSDNWSTLAMNRFPDPSSVSDEQFKRGFWWSPNVRTLQLYLMFAGLSVVVAMLFFTQTFTPPSLYAGSVQQKQKGLVPGSKNTTAPSNTTVIGVVFYGRRSRASILDCYLQRNLVSNGGILKEVHWSVNTDDQEDLAYLDDLIDTTPFYRKIYPKGVNSGKVDYKDVWRSIVKPGHIYVKFDDDVLFVDDDAISQMTSALQESSDIVVVSANMVNSPESNWLHYHLGAIHPFLPEIPSENTIISSDSSPTWRVSQLPQWNGPKPITAPDVKDFENFFGQRRTFESKLTHIPPHRWLPLKDTADISRTPIAQSSYDAFGPGQWSWAIAAQQLYSFLKNLEDRTTALYHMNGHSSLWDQAGDRYSINLIALRGEDLLAHLHVAEAEGWDDERFITQRLPALVGRKLVVHTRALAVHYAFSPQQEMDRTDLLSRYKVYAKENVCPGGDFLEPAS